MNALLQFFAATSSSGSPLGSLVILLPLGLFGYYILVVQPKKARQKHSALVSALQPGDAVVTSGGIHGTVVHLDDAIIEIEVDTDVVLRVSASSLARVEKSTTDDAATDGSNATDESSKKKK